MPLGIGRKPIKVTSLLSVLPFVAILISLFAVYYSRRSSQIALLANAPMVFVQCGIRPKDENEDELKVVLINSGPTEALDVYVELYPRLDQDEINEGFTDRLPLSTWREPRILAKSAVPITSKMIMYRGLGLPPGFYARGFLFAWVFWKDRLGDNHARLSPVYDLEREDHTETSNRRHIGPTKVSPSAHLRWRSEARRRKWKRQKRAIPYQIIDPRIRMQSIYSVKAEPGDFQRPLTSLFPDADPSALEFPLLTITSEQEGDAPQMFVVTDEPGVVDTVWTFFKPWSEPAADTQIRLYRSSDVYDLIRIPWNHATVANKLSAILDQVRSAYQTDRGPANPSRLRIDLSELDGDRVSVSAIVSGHP